MQTTRVSVKLTDSSVDRHNGCCVIRNRRIALSVLAICILMVISILLNPAPSLPQGPVDTVSAAVAVFFAVCLMSTFKCFRERLVLAIIAASLGVTFLSNLGYSKLLPGSIAGIKLTLWIAAAAISLTMVISSVRYSKTR